MLNKTYDRFEDELDAIRLSLYEEIKGMTPEEEIAHLHANTDPIIKEFGLEISTLQPIRPMKRERIVI